MLDVFSNTVVDGGRQCQVEQTVGSRGPRQRQDVCIELGEGALSCVIPADVRVPAKEGRQPVRFGFCHLSGENKERYKRGKMNNFLPDEELWLTNATRYENMHISIIT